MAVGRFAPSTTGPAHSGTLLAGLLCWLDARSRGDRVVLRLEDLDPGRSSPELVQRMQGDLAWLGLDWDSLTLQSRQRADHEAALDRLASQGSLYPCRCTRSEIRAVGLREPDGSWRYPGTCRERSLPAAGWRGTSEPLRARLSAELAAIDDESGRVLQRAGGPPPSDPVVRRRDGAVAYQLASVVDDAASGVTRVIRGRDLAGSTPVQVALQQLLGLPTPAYRHHLLLLEERGDKLAKLHGAVGIEELRAHYSAHQLCGWLAFLADLRPSVELLAARELIDGFRWESVRVQDRGVRWTGSSLEEFDPSGEHELE